MVFEACGSAAASVAVPRKQGLDRNRPGWRDNPLRDWVRTFSLVPHGFKPLLSLSLPLDFSLGFLVRHCEALSRRRASPLGSEPLPIFSNCLKLVPHVLQAKSPYGLKPSDASILGSEPLKSSCHLQIFKFCRCHTCIATSICLRACASVRSAQLFCNILIQLQAP